VLWECEVRTAVAAQEKVEKLHIGESPAPPRKNPRRKE
jgi:G:T-mismatch repair DNA endonuclease (very short patch repair protein)